AELVDAARWQSGESARDGRAAGAPAFAATEKSIAPAAPARSSSCARGGGRTLPRGGGRQAFAFGHEGERAQAGVVPHMRVVENDGANTHRHARANGDVA